MRTQLSLKPAGGLPASKKEETEEVGDDTTSPTWGGGLSTSLSVCLIHKSMGPQQTREKVERNGCGRTSTTPGLKGPTSILLQAVTRKCPERAP